MKNITAEERMKTMHASQIRHHEQSYGAPLGQLKTEPTRNRLDKDYEDRRVRGALFTQTKKD